MESNAHDTFGNQDSSTATTASIGSASAGLDTSTNGTSTDAGEKLADVGSSVRSKAGDLKNSIADALASGAERLRQQQSRGGQLADASPAGGSADTIAENSRLAQTSNQIAGGMQGAADWLRDADLDGVKSGIERQVKDHPGRSLAIAVGVGYLLGKAFRRQA
ncbi:MAG: hypothetical protein ABJE10_03505 [bacterium]